MYFCTHSHMCMGQHVSVAIGMFKCMFFPLWRILLKQDGVCSVCIPGQYEHFFMIWKRRNKHSHIICELDTRNVAQSNFKGSPYAFNLHGLDKWKWQQVRTLKIVLWKPSQTYVVFKMQELALQQCLENEMNRFLPFSISTVLCMVLLQNLVMIPISNMDVWRCNHWPSVLYVKWLFDI